MASPVASVLACLTLALSVGSARASGQFQTLHVFSGGDDGALPDTPLVADGAGNFYGVTGRGGVSGDGVVFKLRRNGEEIVLHTFADEGDGKFGAGISLSPSGDLYGTAAGGPAQPGAPDGCGVLFRLKGHVFSVIHTFGGVPDGCYPSGGLVVEADGTIYGATQAGGDGGAGCSQAGCGVIYRIDPDGQETVFYRFGGLASADGAQPIGVSLADTGDIVGSTTFGGLDRRKSQCSLGCGTLYKISPGGVETVLYRFRGSIDGANPSELRLVGDQIYGSTPGGGRRDTHGYGVVFGYSAESGFTTLHRFTGGAGGATPSGILAWDPKGILYGGTEFHRRGPDRWGKIFALRTSGHYSVLATLLGNDGSDPAVGLSLDGRGHIVGAAVQGGPKSPSCKIKGGCGVIFELNP